MRQFNQTGKLLIALLISATLSFAEESIKPDSPYYLLPEAAMLRPPILTPVPNSKLTLLVPAIMENGTLRYLTKPEMLALPIKKRADFDQIAKKNSTKALAAIKPVIIRNSKNVIELIVLETNNQLAATSILAPDFTDRFSPLLGPDIVALIPSRDKVYLFPKIAGHFDLMARTVVDEFEVALHPVSYEVFEIRNGELQAIGVFPRN
ncbi:MAG: hypothetical protein ABIP97_06730 [Chthoniobacterales bacterium]